MKKRQGDAFMPADDFGRSLPRGLGINLIVSDIEAEIAFCITVMGA